MVKLKLDEKNHKYTVDDKRVPSVTEIVNRVIPRDFYADEWYLKRGTAMHRALALFLQGRLDESTVDPRIRGKVEAGKRAVKELSLKPPYVIEKPLFHKIYNYAGKLDLYLPEQKLLIDWKSSPDKSSQPQGGAYALLLENAGYKVNKFYEIILKDSGKYTVNEYKIAKCKRIFLSCLTIYNFLEKKGGE